MGLILAAFKNDCGLSWVS